VKTICGSGEPLLYLVRSFTYRIEQARADKVQRVIMYNMKFDDGPLMLKHVEFVKQNIVLW